MAKTISGCLTMTYGQIHIAIAIFAVLESV